MGSEEAVPCAQMAQGRAGLRLVEASVRGEPLSVRWGMLARAVDQEGRDWGQTETRSEGRGRRRESWREGERQAHKNRRERGETGGGNRTDRTRGSPREGRRATG